MQAKIEPMPQGVPNVLKQLIWDPVPTSDAQPVNETEAALAQLIDAKHRVRSVNCVPKFLQVLQKAKTEADEALVLVILRATATASDAKLSAACTAGFEKCGGLKIAKKWLNEAVEWNYSDLLVLLLDVLKVLPVQLTSITEARINEPIVTLRKTAQEEKVKRAAQDLLKHWRGRFTEKEKEKTKAASTTASSTSTTETTTKPVPKTSTATTVTPSAASAAASAPPKKSTDTAVKESKALKRRPIKWLDQAPSTTASGSNAPASKSSELIGNLMQRKSAKEAASAKAAKDPSSDNKESTSSESSSKQASSESSTQKPKKEEMVMQLPAIQSFKAVATTSVSKKIRWADEEGKDLVKVKLIESWRDMIHHSPHDENSFKDAKLREHEAERQAMKNHKDREAFHVVMAHEWTTPALIKMPEALSARREPVRTEEVEAQSARTRREMEFLVLDGEVPPVSPKEWTRTNEPHRGAPKEIPLLDVDAAAAAAAVPVTSAPYGEPPETDEERALRESLGPLQRSTIALLMENEHVLPMVYEEAQRNGNRIPDGRVVEIVDFHRRQAPPHQYHHNQLPPRGFNAQPPPSSQAYDGGYNKYGGGGGYNNGPPVVGGGGPGGYDYGHQYGPPGAQQPPPMHHQSLKRKAPGGILADAPPNKRGSKRGTLQCMYFASPAGCRHGNNCQYAHEGGPGGPGGPPGPHMGMPVDYGNAYGPPPGGRFGGHQPPMGMRGGGGMRGMRGGR